MKVEHTQIAIVGGGLAGLTAARLLAKEGRDILVLEARNRLGGRLEPTILGDGTQIDLGGQWHGPGQERIISLSKEMGIASYRTHERGKTCFNFQKRSGSYRGMVAPRHLPAALGALWSTWRLERLAQRIEERGGWANEDKRASQSLGDWIENNTWPLSGRALLHLMLQSLLCRPTSEVSLGSALYFIAKCGSLQHALSVNGGAQESLFEGGTGRLIEGLAASFSSRIRTGAPIRKIEEKQSLVVLSGDDFEVRAQRVVVTVPLPLLRKIEFLPPLESERSRLVNASEMGKVVKTMVIYSSPFWRKKGLSGELWSEDSMLVTGCYDTSPPKGALGVLSILSTSVAARSLGSMNAEERRSAILSELAAHFGEEAKAPQHYVERLWADEEWSLGGYAASIEAGAGSSTFASLRKCSGRIHWAGTETATKWTGYMEGAVESGERAAAEILSMDTIASPPRLDQ